MVNLQYKLLSLSLYFPFSKFSHLIKPHERMTLFKPHIATTFLLSLKLLFPLPPPLLLLFLLAILRLVKVNCHAEYLGFLFSCLLYFLPLFHSRVHSSYFPHLPLLSHRHDSPVVFPSSLLY